MPPLASPPPSHRRGSRVERSVPQGTRRHVRSSDQPARPPPVCHGVRRPHHPTPLRGRRSALVRTSPHRGTASVPNLVTPATMDQVTARRVLFVCTHNSARSQLAAAEWKRPARSPWPAPGPIRPTPSTDRALDTASDTGSLCRCRHPKMAHVPVLNGRSCRGRLRPGPRGTCRPRTSQARSTGRFLTQYAQDTNERSRTPMPTSGPGCPPAPMPGTQADYRRRTQ